MERKDLNTLTLEDIKRLKEQFEKEDCTEADNHIRDLLRLGYKVHLRPDGDIKTISKPFDLDTGAYAEERLTGGKGVEDYYSRQAIRKQSADKVLFPKELLNQLESQLSPEPPSEPGLSGSEGMLPPADTEVPNAPAAPSEGNSIEQERDFLRLSTYNTNRPPGGPSDLTDDIGTTAATARRYAAAAVMELWLNSGNRQQTAEHNQAAANDFDSNGRAVSHNINRTNVLNLSGNRAEEPPATVVAVGAFTDRVRPGPPPGASQPSDTRRQDPFSDNPEDYVPGAPAQALSIPGSPSSDGYRYPRSQMPHTAWGDVLNPRSGRYQNYGTTDGNPQPPDFPERGSPRR